MKKTQVIFNRFLKGFIAGATSTMLLVATVIPKSFGELKGFFGSLFFAAVYGGITGGLLALQKWYSWVDDPSE